MTIQEVINTLRSVAQTTDKDSVYNSENTIEGSLSKKTGVFIPDEANIMNSSMDEANIMRSKVMEVFNSFSNDIKSNFTLILSEVKRWIKGLRSQLDDPGFQKYIANKFRHHGVTHGVWYAQ